MTTTGGPEHFLADPAIDKQVADDPVVLDRAEPLDGDDITVEPAAPGSGPRRVRLVTAAAIASVLVVGGVAIAVADRHHASSTGASSLRSIAPVSPPAAHPTPPRAVETKPAHPAKPASPVNPVKPVASKPVTIATTPVNIAPPPPVNAASPPAQATPPVATPTPPPVTTPPAEPPSVLRWTATPATLSIVGGTHASVTVTVSNPTNGTVTLGTPLLCAPTVRGPHGAVIGGGLVCEQIAQVMQPHSKLTQRYTIYATDTGDVTGDTLKPGAYTATFENLFKMKVNVTAN